MSQMDNAIPSPSPQSPRADLFGIVQMLEIITEVDKDRLLNAEEIADKVFTFLSDVSDDDLESGKIKTNDPSLEPYVAALNRLFPLIRNPQTGAVNQLNSNTLERINKKAYSISAAIGGRPFVELMCDIVNQEFKGRFPDNSDLVVKEVSPLFSAPISHHNDSSKARDV